MTPLKRMWAQQTTLVDKYVENQKQGPYPMTLEDKPNQAFLRELFGFLEEELFEAYEHLETMGLALHTILPRDLGKPDVANYLKEFNEEIADTMAFFIEIFMYIGYDEQTVHDYYTTMLEQMDMLDLDMGPDTLQTSINYSKMILGYKYHKNFDGFKVGAVNLLFHNPVEVPEMLIAGNYISDTIVNISREYLFHSIKHIKRATNCLKMKYWRENGEGVNYEKFYAQLMEAWLNYMVVLYINGYLSSEQIAWNFEQKNTKNLKRIEEKW